MNNNIIYFLNAKEKRGYIMCTVLENIRGKKPQKILEEYGLDKTLPIDIESLLYNLGISAIGKDFSELEKKKNLPSGSILGILLSSGNNAAIFYRQSDTYNRIRFTIAHELAHAIIHTDNKPHIEYRMTKDEIEQSALEKEANTIAGELLIPFNLLKKEYLNLSVPSSIILANIFKVSVNVMEARLDKLGISYFNSVGKAIVK